MFTTEIFHVKDKLPDVECGSFLVYAPKSFPKNSRWLVAEYYNDIKGFYSEAGEDFMEDVTHWCRLPDEPNSNNLTKRHTMSNTPNPYPEKSARWWFHEYLQEPYKSQAIANSPEKLNAPYSEYRSLASALSHGFDWEDSPEKHEYWSIMEDRALSGEFSTPNPPSPTAEQIASATKSFEGIDTDAYMDEVRGRDNEENTLAKCPECGGLRGGHSNRRCSLMNLEYAQQEIINVEQRWIKIQSETISNWQKDKARLKSKIDFFQSKLAALKHENNQLRRKIKPTP